MEIIMLIMVAAAVLLLAILLVKSSRQDTTGELENLKTELRQGEAQRETTLRQSLELLRADIRQDQQNAAQQNQQALMTAVDALGRGLNDNMKNIGTGVQGNLTTMGQVMADSQDRAAAVQSERLEQINKNVMERQEAMNLLVAQKMLDMETQLKKLEEMSEQKLEALRQSMQSSMQEMRQENAKKLDEIRGTVDEKLQDTLQKRIHDSFETVSRQLEQVYKGLGEMQHLATDVGGLKQVLSGVKTRGILGEIQLGAILEEILSTEQYETNVATIPGSRERVEFAVKLPGSDGGTVWLPIDSKFPGDTYMHLQDAMASGDPAEIALQRKNLETVLKKSAKDIRDKYVEPPHTTTFGIMFLPFEGLYAEVVNLGMIEVLQREYNVNIAGPSTMAALLNSLQMGFRTLAIQKRSNEVWKVLGEVKSEFTKFEDVMKKMQGHLQQTSNDLETLMGTRSRAISRKLRDVEALDEPKETLFVTE